MENGRCNLHGGLSTGPKTLTAGGRYSKYLPTRLAEKYESAISDAELISVRDEAAVVQTFIANTLEELDFENCQAAWDTLEVLMKEFWNAGKDPEKAAVGYQMATTIQDGVREWQKVRAVLGYIEQKRKLVDTETRRMNELETTINAKEANALIGALLGIIREEVPDSAVHSRIALKLAGIVHRAA